MIFPRLLIGWIILVCAEVFSGASLQMGLWHPWTLLVTYWLYFAHFFFFTTLAVRTGRTSFWPLYLWGVLFGLYESWITKVIWHGYGGDGQFVLGKIGPYGYSEISMVFLFHPLMSFLLPLVVACLLCPPLRRFFPDLAWLTGMNRGARAVRIYFVIAFVPIVAMNSGGPKNLALNVALVLGSWLLLSRLARPGLDAADAPSIVFFRRGGFIGLCLYLAMLYGLTYFFLRPEGLPSIPVQLLTFVFYALAVAGLWLHLPRSPLAESAAAVDDRELKRVVAPFVFLLVLGFALSFLKRGSALFVPVLASFVCWTPAGFILMALALLNAVRDRRS